VLIDMLGQLLLWYGAADVVFLGGTLVNIGGHNPVEAAAMGTMQVIGPYHQQIEHTAAALAATGAAILLSQQNDLATHIIEVLGDNARRRHVTSAAQLLISQQHGALAKTTDWIDKQLANRKPSGQ
jgi:3-deoxy-D-manno-octulosonic-acid transferase